MCTLHNTSQLYLTVLHKYMNCNVKWNWKIIKMMKLKFEWYLNVSGTVDSSVVRMVIGLANWVMGGIFGTGERKRQNCPLGGLGVGGDLLIGKDCLLWDLIYGRSVFWVIIIDAINRPKFTHSLTQRSTFFLQQITSFMLVKDFPKIYENLNSIKFPPTFPILSQLHPVHTTSYHFLKVHLDIIQSSTPVSHNWSLSFKNSPQNGTYDT